MRAIICHCDAEVAKELPRLLREAGMEVSEVEPDNKCLLRVSNSNTYVIVWDIIWDMIEAEQSSWESCVWILISRSWTDILLRRDPRLELAKQVRAILANQTIGNVSFEDKI